MDLLVSILLVSLSAGTRAHTIDGVTKERGARSYFRHFNEELEPYAFAAVPLHQPVPMVRVLSPSPQYKFEVPYGEMEPTFNYYQQQPVYSASMMDPRATEPSESSWDPQLDVIYARPNKRGPAAHRKHAAPRPTGFRPPRPSPPLGPVILRVHKYKFVRDR